jgi:hypothetical protein
MIEQRKIAFDNISRVLAITRYDIEQHQLVNDQSLNIHGENWFRDIFNFVYEKNFFINANLETKTGNSSAIDLIDKEKKLAYQITTTRTKEKVDESFKKLAKTSYRKYILKIFFLLDKSKFQEPTKQYFKDTHGINIEKHLFDYTDLLKDIEALETSRLIELNHKLFLKIADTYTDNIVLDLIFKHLLTEKNHIKIDFDDDFGTIDSNEKLKLNNINSRIASKINDGLDYRVIIDGYKEEDNLLTELKDYIIDDIYKVILLKTLETKVSKKELLDKKTYELQDIASSYDIDFNKLVNKLHQEIEINIEINDFNSMNIAWIIIAYFFEICDIGVDELC